MAAVATMAKHTKAHHQHHTQIGQRVQDMEPVVGDQVHGGRGGKDRHKALRPGPGPNAPRSRKIAHATKCQARSAGGVVPNDPAPDGSPKPADAAATHCLTYP